MKSVAIIKEMEAKYERIEQGPPHLLVRIEFSKREEVQ